MRHFKVLLLTLLIAGNAYAVNRVGQKKLDLGNVEQIQLAPGLISLMEFPESVTEVSIGAPQIYKAQISPVHPTEVLIQITDTKPYPTNMIVRTTKRIFVFDLKPNLKNHQDVFKVKETYGTFREVDEVEALHQRRLKAEREWKERGL